MPAKSFKLHLLDVGVEPYSDAVLLDFGTDTVLVDGAHTHNDVDEGPTHPALQSQIAALLKKSAGPVPVSLLVVTHAHEDHIGCLPSLVLGGHLTAEWALVVDPDYGWGRAGADAANPLDGVADERLHQAVAALREESRPPLGDAPALARFLADAPKLEPGYRDMLARLQHDGTKVVRHGRQSAATLTKRFAAIGLQVLGPSPRQLELTAARINGHTGDAIAAARQALASDAGADAVSLYRRLVAGGADAADAGQRLGNEVNLQSVVTTFACGGWKLLLAGDMQLSKPSSSPEVEALVKALRAKVAARGPYDFVKLCHHGSDNGWDATMFDELGKPKWIGICAGEGSTKHPNPKVLADLATHAGAKWARTDHNGQVSFSFAGSKIAVTKKRGAFNDDVPNKDEVVAPPPPPLPAAAVVEVVARVPYGAQVTITVLPPKLPALSVPEQAVSALAAPLPPLVVAGGRPLPALLVVTSRDGLATNIGSAEAAQVLEALSQTANLVVYDGLPAGISDPAQADALVRARLDQHDVEGVVLLGGYDIVPSQKLGCVPKELRGKVDEARDTDRFVVWSDDFYVADADNMPDLPISRIPDAHWAPLMFAALGASGALATGRRSGIRNQERPFADGVFELVPGAGEMQRSGPDTFDHPQYLADGDNVYLMLHGGDFDGTRFWGGEPWERYPMVTMGNVPDRVGRVVFTGCCWGALTVDPPAGMLAEGQALSPRSPERSLALRFLLNGAVAFVGCTGMHYSPLVEPYDYHGGPMHHAFWTQLAAGMAPAAALFEAKKRFAAETPHGLTDPFDKAVDAKIHRQYTCLGLGW